MCNYQFFSVLFSWLIFNKDKRRNFRHWCKDKDEAGKAAKIQKNYPKIIERIKSKKGKIRVLFLVTENSKWKAQPLYDVMEKSDDFEPVIAVTLLTKAHKGKDTTRNDMEENYNFFIQRGMNVVRAYQNKKYVDLKEFEPDIVFYQQPYFIAKEHSPEKVGKFALLCYIPYFVPNYGGKMDYNQPLHKYLFRHYILNKWWEDEYNNASGLNNFVGLGHPMLDNFCSNQNIPATENMVIYAPHYSFSHKNNENPVNYGTFLDTGEKILEFAKAHPEIKWVFKPHPQLKFSLLKIGEPAEKVENYYKEWEKIGVGCYDSSYAEWFLRSRTLITDCGSFLTEYFSTGKPIIHLISSDCKITPMEPSKKIFDTFYKAHNTEEMNGFLERVILKNDDYLKDTRLKMLEESGLKNNRASENILNDLREILR